MSLEIIDAKGKTIAKAKTKALALLAIELYNRDGKETRIKQEEVNNG